jgi:hypothetical protein
MPIDSTRWVWKRPAVCGPSVAAVFDADLTTLYAVDSVWVEHRSQWRKVRKAPQSCSKCRSRRAPARRAPANERVAEIDFDARPHALEGGKAFWRPGAP